VQYIYFSYEKDMANVIFETMIDVICKQKEIYITPKIMPWECDFYICIFVIL